MINIRKLTQELKTAGIVNGGCNANGVVWDINGNEIQDRPDVAAIIAAHDPAREVNLSPSQQIILADDITAAEIIIFGEPNASIDFAVNGSAQSITLDASGRETIELTSDTPGTTIVVQAGTARAVVYAVEVPS